MQDILLVEDDIDDIYFFLEAIKAIDPKINVNFLKDGSELMDWLKTTPSIHSSLIFLDLSTPKFDGRQVLKTLHDNKIINLICLVVYTTSSNPKDIKYAAEMGAKSYIVKPDTIKDLKAKLETTIKYWFTVNHEPLPF
ncbi:response regulator [Saccharobesus litoralis]|nr:response regulator [Saccharobesus litoralis]